ncbi:MULTISPECIES: hypothetical protein [Bacillota]|uniref:hypothetical protein n=1 Tax=Bacillota TaxID=1239 RepID=UPI000B43037D|nr:MULTISPECIES: hypothetical protein [Bacillota]OUN34108.1 hypothetical protein B5G32_09410 [Massilimicrobiota sp. An80]QUN13285.1 hypothetical protein KEC48_01805 [Clostridium sp. C1]
MKKVNPYLLGICVAYFILGIKQIFSNGVLSYKIYFIVSVVSLSISLAELLKILSKSISQDYLEIRELINLYDMCYDHLKSDIKQNNLLLDLENRKKLFESSEKKRSLICKTSELVIVISYVNSICAIILIPWLDISNNLLINKINGAATLFCFALMFFTNLLNEYTNNTRTDFEIEKQEIIEKLYAIYTKK